VLVAQNDSQDRFVAFGERSAPRNDGLNQATNKKIGNLF